MSKQFHENRLPEQCSKPGAARSPQPGSSVHICYRVTEYWLTLAGFRVKIHRIWHSPCYQVVAGLDSLPDGKKIFQPRLKKSSF